MLGLGISLWQAALGGGGFSVEATDFFARSTVPFSAPRKILIDDLISALKAGGVWAKLDYLQVYSQETQQAALLNWTGDFNNAAIVGAPPWIEDEGFGGFSTGNYLSLGFNPGAGTNKYLRNDAMFGVWSRSDQAQENTFAIGQRTGNLAANANLKLRLSGDLNEIRINEDTTVTGGTGIVNAIGSHIVCRSGAGAGQFYRNGAPHTAIATASSALANRVWFLGSMNSNGSATTFSTAQISASFAGGSLTDGQALALHNGLSAYFDSVLEA